MTPLDLMEWTLALAVCVFVGGPALTIAAAIIVALFEPLFRKRKEDP